ncbi:hypothetical protein JTE90_001638 [Oedothorax gibbosus]|uniref:BHLH domain-containing protein n=1 Tax=Oedothorax gibbosus TaxID=931172 RepID=A0AAV6VM41_9ARAC|nr:hypothetical protein JTE90_001638 [Oedothorax gibbosus]
MEDIAYQFGSENINLTDVNINDGDCTSFVTDHEDSARKRLDSDEDFQTIDHEQFGDITSFPGLNPRTTEIEEDLKIVYDSSTTVCSSDLQYNKECIKDFQDCRIVNHHDVKESSTEEEPRPKPFIRRGAQLIRLQVAPDPSKQQPINVEDDDDLKKDNTSTILFQEAKLENVKFELAKNAEEDIRHSENVTIQGIPSTSQASIVFIDDTGSDFILPRTKECSPKTPTVSKTEMLEENSSLPRSLTDVTTDSTRVNSNSSFPSINLSGTVSSDYQSFSSTSPHGSDFFASKYIQRFITADNKVVYGCKDTNGEFNYVSQDFIDKQTHNEKERFRRSRVSGACGALRKLVPGLTERTDKATVFERSALYLTFLRDKFQSQFDQSYREKYFTERQ